MTVQRLSFLWIIWFVLVVVLPHAEATFPPPSLSLSQISSPWSVRQPQAGLDHFFFGRVLSLSQELILQGERQSKKVLMRVYRFNAALQKQQKAAYIQLAPVPLSCLVRFFLPRKLFPSSVTDDPFLS